MRRLNRYKLASLFLCGLAAASGPAVAQVGRAKLRSEAVPRQEARPDAQPLRVDQVSPGLDRVLKDWFQKTQGVKKLQGEHHRWKYDTTFGVAKIAKGSFYYEGPDKGRIDVEPVPPTGPGQTVQDAQKNVYTVKLDQPERWVCDGKRILKIDDSERTYETLPIPPEHQGANIMDGPLPFLFGMPPEKAKQRYQMKLVKQDAEAIYLDVRPRQRADAANWQRADVMLAAHTYLPKAVQLIDPAATGVTVFKFENTQVNSFSVAAIFGASPFRPNLFGFKPVRSEAGTVAQPLNLQGKPIEGLPSVVGMRHDDAKNVLAQRGFRKVNVRPGPVTAESDLRLCVAEQSPAPGANTQPEGEVTLLLYVTEEDLKKYSQKPQP